MASSRAFWVAFAVYGIGVSLRWLAESLSGPPTTVSLVGGVSGLGITLIAVYGSLRPDAAGGPSARSPLAYCAVLAAILSTASLVIRVV